VAGVLYLASRSPQRATLLARAGVAFSVIPSTCREEDIDVPLAQALAIERARAKAAGGQAPPGAVILGADTVVSLGREILGSPATPAEAAVMLGKLSGTTHQVLTGHCLVRLAEDGSVAAEAVALTMARITMRPLSAAEIAAYAATGEGVGKAGGYAIQEHADGFVADLQGAIETVIGLHVPTVAKLWREVATGTLPGYAGPVGSGPQQVLR
jgi:septum formation protein